MRLNLAAYREQVKGLILKRLPTVDEFVQEWVEDSAQIVALPDGRPFKALGLIDKPKNVVRGFKVRIFHL